jgi:hypothetical protein
MKEVQKGPGSCGPRLEVAGVIGKCKLKIENLKSPEELANVVAPERGGVFGTRWALKVKAGLHPALQIF